MRLWHMSHQQARELGGHESPLLCGKTHNISLYNFLEQSFSDFHAEKKKCFIFSAQSPSSVIKERKTYLRLYITESQSQSQDYM